MRSGISAASFEQDILRIKALTKITHYNVEIKRRNISLTGVRKVYAEVAKNPNFAGDLQRDLLAPTEERPNHNPLAREM
jgi:hypothetical protein